MEIVTVVFSDRNNLWRQLLWHKVIEITYGDSYCGLL